MVTLVPVDGDPFAAATTPAAPDPTPTPQATGAAPRLVPVDHNPFASTTPTPAASIPTETVKASMPALGVLPGKVNLNAAIAPDVIAGAPRPFAPGEWVDNPDGSWSSEITGTVSNPALNGGRATVVPTLWIVDGKPVRVDEDTAAAYAAKSGLKFPSYDSDADAEAASVKREADWQGIDRHQASSVKPLWVDTSGWDTPGAPVTEAVPFQDKPGTYRGNILPMARDAQGNLSAAVPGLLAAPVRGVIEGGQEARGVRPVDDPSARGDIAAAMGFGVRPAGKLFTTPEQKAAETLRMHRGTPEGRADQVIERRLNQDVRGGGAQVQPPVEHGPPPGPGAPPQLALPTTPADNVVANLDRMREGGKPATLIDVGGPNTKALAGSVARTPGAAQGVIRGTMENRDMDAGVRAQADVKRYLNAGPSAYRTTRDLIGQRSAEGNPLYQKAFEGGSMAPLEQQFQDAWVEAGRLEKQTAADVTTAQSQLNAALAKDPVTQGNVYSASAANAAIRAAKANLQRAQQAQASAAAGKADILQHLQQAQEDIANGTPGAVWNPRIQQFLNLPDVKKGLARGYQIQRNDAVADGVPFNPSEYALTPDGEVIRVPNMRTLNVAKKGLDAIISDSRDEFGRLTEYGVSVDKVRRAFLAEMDKINPDYATARQSWAGHSASLDAVKWGKNVNRLPPEQVAEEFGAMSESEKEFARRGLADTLLERIGKTSFTGDEAKAVINNQWTKDQLQPLFKSEADFTRYVESVAHERLMKDTQNRVLAGSQTAERGAEDMGNGLAVAGHVTHGALHAMSGNTKAALMSAFRAYRDLGMKPDEAMTEAIARSLTDPNRVPAVVGGQFQFPVPTMRVRPGFRWGAPKGEPVAPTPGADEPFRQ